MLSLHDNLYFTSDHHFGHKNIIQYCKRPYDSLEEMEEDFIKKWNETVSKDAIVFQLGDFFLCNNARAKSIIDRLNGTIYWIKGNHDKEKTARFLGIEIYDRLEVKVKHKDKYVHLVLDHFPLSQWNKGHKGSIHLHGHCHGIFNNIGRTMDVGVDCNNYRPVSFVDMLDIVQNNYEREQSKYMEAYNKGYQEANAKDPLGIKNVNFTYHDALDDIKSFKKYKKQRLKRGFDDTELWGLDSTIAKFVYPRLEALKKLKKGWPVGISEEEWDFYMDKMINTFKEIAEGDYIDDKHLQEGIDLFAKYYFALWD